MLVGVGVVECEDKLAVDHRPDLHHVGVHVVALVRVAMAEHELLDAVSVVVSEKDEVEAGALLNLVGGLRRPLVGRLPVGGNILRDLLGVEAVRLLARIGLRGILGLGRGR